MYLVKFKQEYKIEETNSFQTLGNQVKVERKRKDGNYGEMLGINRVMRSLEGREGYDGDCGTIKAPIAKLVYDILLCSYGKLHNLSFQIRVQNCKFNLNFSLAIYVVSCDWFGFPMFMFSSNINIKFLMGPIQFHIL